MHTYQKYLAAASLVLCLMLLFGINAPAHAQTSLGQITGTVEDSTGGVVPGTAVTITNEGTHEVHAATTDGNGYFIQTNLPIGDYTVEVQKSGFRPEKRTGIVLSADAHLTANFTLQVGTATEAVTVTAELGEALNTTSGELAHVIDTREVETLPLNAKKP